MPGAEGARQPETETARAMGRRPAAAPAPAPATTPQPAQTAAAEAAGAAGQRNVRGKRNVRAWASADRARQSVLDLEVFISQLLLRREAFPELSSAQQRRHHHQQQQQSSPPRPRKGVASGATNAVSSSAQSSLSAAAAVPGRRVGSASVDDDRGGNQASAGVSAAAVGGGRGRRTEEDLSAVPSVLTMDYHCATVGLIDGGRRVLLCLVVEVAYPRARSAKRQRGVGPGVAAGGGEREAKPGNRERERGGTSSGANDGVPGADAGALEDGPSLLGYILALDLATGEVVVLNTRSGRGDGGSRRCAPLCETLARAVRRSGAVAVDRPGRRLSNANVVQGRSLETIINPVYPVAIVMGRDDA
ncbi:unnamed protein product [Scytosiphon promiscuus]